MTINYSLSSMVSYLIDWNDFHYAEADDEWCDAEYLLWNLA